MNGVIRSRFPVWCYGIFLNLKYEGLDSQRVPITLLLVIDLLIGLLFSLVLAQPQMIINKSVDGVQHHIILVDRSISMQADDALPDRLAQAKLAAVKLINDAGPQDVISVIAFDAAPVLVGDLRLMSVQQLVQNVTNLASTTIGHAISEALPLGLSLIDENPARFIVISDQAFIQPDLSAFPYPLTWINIGNSTKNQAVTQLTMEWIGDNQLQVFARISNFSETPIRRMIALLVDDNPYDSQSIYIPGGQDIDQIWQLVSRPGTICVNILGDDILAADDQRCLGLSVPSDVSVVFVSNESLQDRETLQRNPIYRALIAIDGVGLQVMQFSDYSPLLPADVTVFQNCIPSTWPSGVVMLFFPPGDQGKESNELVSLVSKKTMISQGQNIDILTDDLLLDSIDFSGLRWGNAIENQVLPPNLLRILAAGGTPLMLKDTSKGQSIYIIGSDLTSGNFIQHPAFPLIFANLISLARTSALSGEIIIGQPLSLPDANLYPSIKISDPGGHEATYGLNAPALHSDTHLPGIYQIDLVDIEGKVSTYFVGANAGSREESNLTFQPRTDVQAKSQQIGFDNSKRKIALFPWLLGLAIILLVTEARIAWR